jgi:nucleoid DNA-binding protein
VSVTAFKLALRVQEDLEKAGVIKGTDPQLLLKIMNRVFYQIGDALAAGEDVYLEGFGRFYPDCKPPRKVKSGLTSEVHTTDYKVFVRFNAFKQLNKRVQEFLCTLGVYNDQNE